MSLTLGEKLRQAREERGISLSEVAENTRISPIYLECIDHDDYRSLPGGIFNRGFVKSYAKYVGLNEEEALLDYAQLAAETEVKKEDTFKTYRPEPMADDRSSIVPTLIVAAVILAAMTGGILLFVSYIRQPAAPPAVKPADVANANSAVETDPNTQAGATIAQPVTAFKVEFKAINQPVSLSATSDGTTNINEVNPGTAKVFEPNESLKLSYSRSRSQFAQMTINDKPITLPQAPLDPKRSIIEFEINKANIDEIITTGAISPGAVPASPTPSRSKPTPKPSASANTAPTPGIKASGNDKPTPKTTPAKPARR